MPNEVVVFLELAFVHCLMPFCNYLRCCIPLSLMFLHNDAPLSLHVNCTMIRDELVSKRIFSQDKRGDPSDAYWNAQGRNAPVFNGAVVLESVGSPSLSIAKIELTYVDIRQCTSGGGQFIYS